MGAFGSQIPVMPSPATVAEAQYLKYVVYVHMVFAGMEFIFISIIAGIFSIFFAILGLSAVYNQMRGYKPQQVRCYYWWCVWSTVFDILMLILFYSNVYKPNGVALSTTGYQVVSFLYLGIYACAIYWSGRVFSSLVRDIMEHPQNLPFGMGGGMGGGMVGGGGIAPAYPVQPAAAQPFHAAAQPVASGGVVAVQAVPVSNPGAFQGRAQTLGGPSEPTARPSSTSGGGVSTV